MSSSPPPSYDVSQEAPINPDSRSLPAGWLPQYDVNYKTWFYVNTNTQPPTSSWTHPAGLPLPPSASLPKDDPKKAPVNPDSRPLPVGWLQQFDESYKTWFYVNTNIQPPTSIWTHPAETLPPLSGPPQNLYQPPPGQLPQSNYSTPQQQSPYEPSPPGPGYYGGPQVGFNPPHPPIDKTRSILGGLFGRLPGHHRGSGNSGYGPSPGYGGGYGQPQQVYVQQNKPKLGGLGAGGGAALGLGAGLLGGVLLEDALGNEYEDGYEQGYDQGFDNGDGFDDYYGFGNGDDFGGF